jgi:hypothetical protein
MYDHARAFAAQCGLRQEGEAFEEGDPCPTCQNPLDADAIQRLQRFDDFVRSRAAADAEEARLRLNESQEEIEHFQIEDQAATARALAEYRTLGVPEARQVDGVVAYLNAARIRRARLLTGIAAGEIGEMPALPDNPTAAIRAEARRLSQEAAGLEARPAEDPAQVARVAELTDAKRLSEELEAVLARRRELELRLRLMDCKAALATDPVSRFATQRRRELVTPELRLRIKAEIARLDLSHIPLRVAESTNRGRSFFDVELTTRQEVKKSRVLSEGEQGALGMACFLAEIGRVPGNHGIIIDDPVSSLDHLRLCKVAKRLVEEAATGRQIIIFTHNLVFYQEVLTAATAHDPPVRVLKNHICKTASGQFGLITENDEPWIAKKVTQRIEALRTRLAAIRDNANRETDEYRGLAKDFYTDLRETWERLVEEVLLGGVVERYGAGVKTQSLKGVLVDNDDYRTIFVAMKRVSERTGHDMAAGRQIPAPDKAEMRSDLDTIDQYRRTKQQRKRQLEEERRALEQPPAAHVI